MNIYYYLFYKIYRFTKKLGNYEVAFSSYLGMTFLLMLNLFIPIGKLFSKQGTNFEQLKPLLIILGISIFVLNYFLFIHKRKYIEIIKRFNIESDTKRIIGNVVVTIYFSLTIGSIFLL